jgi:hypothetical protein
MASKRLDGQESKFTEVKDALDDFCHPLGAVACWRSFVVHPGGIYSHPSRGRTCGAAHPTDHGSKSCLVEEPFNKELFNFDGRFNFRAAACDAFRRRENDAGGTTEDVSQP